jgi:hypothetical protein
MPGVARVLGKTGVVVGLGLVLIGPTVQGADAILPPPGTTAAGHEIIPEKATGKAPAKVAGQAKKAKSKAKAKHRQRTATARQSQVGADLKPGVYTSPIVTRPAKSHPARTHLTGTKPKSKSAAKEHRKPPVTTPKLPTKSRMNPVVHHRPRPSLAGSWSLFGGEFKFGKVGARTISDAVISQRIGVFCPKVNDQDGQLVVRQIDKMDYLGTWEWFNPKTCESAGYGTVKIMVWRDRLTATFTAYPPPGTPGPPDTTMMERIP